MRGPCVSYRLFPSSDQPVFTVALYHLLFVFIYLYIMESVVENTGVQFYLPLSNNPTTDIEPTISSSGGSVSIRIECGISLGKSKWLLVFVTRLDCQNEFIEFLGIMVMMLKFIFVSSRLKTL